MEQVKVFVRQLVKHHFWVVSGLVALTGVIVWYLAYSDLSADYETRSKKIDSSYSTLSSVKSNANHPNDFSHKLMQDHLQSTAKSVNSGWDVQYQNQQAVLLWPTDQLKQDFTDAVQKLRPIEKQDPKLEIAQGLRERYRDRKSTRLNSSHT